jgi:hypothetical protein
VGEVGIFVVLFLVTGARIELGLFGVIVFCPLRVNMCVFLVYVWSSHTMGNVLHLVLSVVLGFAVFCFSVLNRFFVFTLFFVVWSTKMVCCLFISSSFAKTMGNAPYIGSWQVSGREGEGEGEGGMDILDVPHAFY